MKKLTRIIQRRIVAACVPGLLAGIFCLAQAQAQMSNGMMGQDKRVDGPAIERSAPQDRQGTRSGGRWTCPDMMGDGMGMVMGHGMGMMMWPGVETMAPDMIPDLTDEQRAELRSMQREMRRQYRETRFEIMELREEMMEEMMADQPDPDRVKELQSSIADLQGEILASRIETRTRIHEMLNDEQREQIRELQRQQYRRMLGQ